MGTVSELGTNDLGVLLEILFCLQSSMKGGLEFKSTENTHKHSIKEIIFNHFFFGREKTRRRRRKITFK